MGGRGSGNHNHWWRPAPKTTTDECLFLDANRWSRAGILRAGVWLSGALTWTNTHTGQDIASAGFELNTLDSADPWVRLSYTRTPVGERMDYGVGLCTTRPNYGGRRWWFACALCVNSRPCGRRVGKLYLP